MTASCHVTREGPSGRSACYLSAVGAIPAPMRRGTSIVIVLDQAVVGHVDDDALGPVEGRLAVHEQLLSWLAEAAIEDRERRLDLEPRRDGTLLSAYGDCAPHELDQLLDRLWGVVAGRSLKLLQSPRPAAGITRDTLRPGVGRLVAPLVHRHSFSSAPVLLSGSVSRASTLRMH